MKPKYKPSLWWLALAPLFLVVGVGGGTTILLKEVLRPASSSTFVAPAVRTFDLTEPGTYVLSHDYRIAFMGRKYEEDANLPDGTAVSLKGPDGDVAMEESWGSGSTSEEHERKEIGRFEIRTPGSYVLTVEGLDSPRVLTFSQSVIARIILSAAASILLSLLGWFGAPAVVIVVLSARLRDKRRFRAEHPEMFEPEEPLNG